MALSDTLVAPFKQREFVAVAGKDVEYGMCVGFSADWVIRHRGHKSEGSVARVNYMKTGSPMRSAVGQRAYIARRDAIRESVLVSGQSSSITSAFTDLGSKVTIADTDKCKYFQSDRENTLNEIFAHTSGVHKYYMIVLSFGENSMNITEDNHVIAGYHSGGKFRGWGSHLYVFEPNMGEFKIGGNGVKGFFTDIAAHYMGYIPKGATKPSPKKLQMVTVHTLAMQ